MTSRYTYLCIIEEENVITTLAPLHGLDTSHDGIVTPKY